MPAIEVNLPVVVLLVVVVAALGMSALREHCHAAVHFQF